MARKLDFRNLSPIAPPAESGDSSRQSLSEMNVGNGNTSYHADKSGIWLGAKRFADATFSVSMLGVLMATGAIISGTIMAIAGAIGGFVIGTDYIRDAGDNFGMASTVTVGDDVRFWAGDTFANRGIAPFFVTEAGNLTANSATIVGTVSGRSTATIAGAIDASGNLITDILNARLNSSAKTLLAGFTFGAADYAGAVSSGTITWNTTTGALTGGSGVLLYRGGIIGAAAGVATFVIDAATGDATFAGTLSAPDGVIGGFDIGATTLSASAGGNTTTMSSGSTAFSAGPTGSPSFTVTQAGALTATSAAITGTISGRSTATVAATINSSGNVITDLINARMDTAAKTMLAGFTFGASDYAGAVSSGTITWNTTTGAITGGSGVLVYRGGIIGAAAGVATFTLDAATGTATFAGTLSAPSGNLGGFTISATTLANGTDILLDAGNKAISINDATFGNEGIQLQFNAGTPRAYIGDGGDNFFRFDGNTVSVSGSLNSQVAATAGEDLLAGDFLAFSAADTAKRYYPTGLPSSCDQSASATGTFVYSNGCRPGILVRLSDSLAFFCCKSNTNTSPGGVRIPVTGSTGAIGTMGFDADLWLFTDPTTLSAVAVSATSVLVTAGKSNSLQAVVVDLSSAVSPGATATIDSSNCSEGFGEYISDSHVPFISQDTSNGNIQFYKYTLSGTTLSSSSSGTLSTAFAGDTYVIKGFRQFGSSAYFLIIVQNTTDATAYAMVAHYDTGSSTFDSVGTPVAFTSVSATIGDNAVFSSLSSTAMTVYVPTSTTAGVYFLVTRSGTVPTVGTLNVATARGANEGYSLTRVNERCSLLCTTDGTTSTRVLLELNADLNDVVVRATQTEDTAPSGNTIESGAPVAAWQVSPTREGFFAFIGSTDDPSAGSGLVTLPVPFGIAKANTNASATVTGIVSGSTNTLSGLTALERYYADWGGLVTTDDNGTPDKVGVTKDTDEIILKSW